MLKLWHLIRGHDWVSRWPELRCRCGAKRSRADWG